MIVVQLIHIDQFFCVPVYKNKNQFKIIILHDSEKLHIFGATFVSKFKKIQDVKEISKFLT